MTHVIASVTPQRAAANAASCARTPPELSECAFGRILKMSVRSTVRQSLPPCCYLSNTMAEISQAVEKMQKRCIVKFTENEMHIICNNDAGEGGIQVWSCVRFPRTFTHQ